MRPLLLLSTLLLTSALAFAAGDAGNSEAAALAWQRALDSFAAHLGR